MPPPQFGPSERLVVRGLFAAVVIALVVQGIVYHKFGAEPYPALFMPSFGGTGGYSPDGVRVSWFEIDLIAADGSVVPMPIDRLFDPMPQSMRGTVLRYFFSPTSDEQIEAAVAASSREFGLRYVLLPGLNRGRRTHLLPESQEALRAWLSGRVAQLEPDREIERIEFRWYTESVRVSRGGFERSREPDEVRNFRLTPRGAA